MTTFTDSPFERMMQEVPYSQVREAQVPPALPENEPCRSCCYKSPVCIGVLCGHKQAVKAPEQETRHE